MTKCKTDMTAVCGYIMRGCFLKKKYLPNINYSTEKNVNKRLTENKNGKFFLYTKF